jgi:hypothetical protein
MRTTPPSASPSARTPEISVAETIRLVDLIRLRTEIAVERWSGAGVVYGRLPDGRATATCLGVTGVGRTEAAALLDMERRLGG